MMALSLRAMSGGQILLEVQWVAPDETLPTGTIDIRLAIIQRLPHPLLLCGPLALSWTLRRSQGSNVVK